MEPQGSEHNPQLHLHLGRASRSRHRHLAASATPPPPPLASTLAEHRPRLLQPSAPACSRLLRCLEEHRLRSNLSLVPVPCRQLRHLEAPLKPRPSELLIPTAAPLSLELQPIRTARLPVLQEEVHLHLAQAMQDSHHKDLPSGQLKIQLQAVVVAVVVVGFSLDSPLLVEEVVVVLTSAPLSAGLPSSTLVSICCHCIC